MTNDPILVVDQLRMHLVMKNAVAKVVDGISLVVHQGEALGIVGESGAGKSMLALSLIGLPPQPYGRIVGGSVTYRGVNLLDPAQARTVVGKKIGMVFENPGTALDMCYRVGTQITETIIAHEAVSKRAARKRALELMRLVGIPDPESAYLSYPHQFSGGMQQRVMIAIALSCEPDLLIADNPTSALDVTIQAQILRLIEELRVRLGLTVIWITHNLGIVAKLCDRVAIMYAGQIVEYGDSRTILKHGRHPYTEALAKVSPKIRGQGELVPIKGMPPSPMNLGAGCRFANRCPKVIDECRVGAIEMEEVESNRSVRCILSKRAE